MRRTDRKPGPIIEATCWAHARRKFFELADLRKAPIALEAVRRIDELFAIECEINSCPPEERCRIRSERSRSLVGELEHWLGQERRKLSLKNRITGGIDYLLKRWAAFTRVRTH